MQVVVGDWAGRPVAEDQPVKLAAFEGLQRTETGAPFTLGGFYDAERAARSRYGIEVPKLLSLLAHHDPNAERAAGSTSVPPADRPPVNVVRFAFQTMVGIGTAARAARRRVLRHLAAQAAVAALARGSTGR